MDGDRHHRLEGWSGSQEVDVGNEDATTICHPPSRSATPVGRNDEAGSSDGRRDAGSVTDLTIAILQQDKDLLSNAILSRCDKTGEVSSPEVLVLEVLLVMFLMCLFHTINITLSNLAYTRVVLVRANNDVRALSELSSGVGTTAAVAREWMPAPTVAAWSGGRTVGRLTAAGGVASDRVLGLAGVSTDDWRLESSSTWGVSEESL